MHPVVMATGCTGVLGCSKTTPAVRWVEKCLGPFPDGASFLEMRGLEDRPLAVEDSVTRLLGAWGVEETRTYWLDSDERLALCHATVARRR